MVTKVIVLFSFLYLKLNLTFIGIDMNWDDLQNEKKFSGFGAYRQTKLGNILFTIELAEKLKGNILNNQIY